MTFFKKIFGREEQSQELPKVHWFYLEDISELDSIEKISFEKPVAIFKHSTRCSISRFALKQLEHEYNIETENMELYFLDLLAHREISNAIAERYQVMHQSPQLIVLKEGKVVYHASHSDINTEDLIRLV